MQRYLLRRILQGLGTLLVISLIVFLLARLSGDPLNIMLSEEASKEDYAVAAKHWGLDRPLTEQYLTSSARAARRCGQVRSAAPARLELVWKRLPRPGSSRAPPSS